MNKSLKNKVYFFTLVISIYITQIWINLYYESSQNADFSKYFDFINYFLKLNVDIDYGHSPLYYFLITKMFESYIKNLTLGNYTQFLSSSIQNMNLILFLIGLSGFYNFLKFKKFKNNTILLSLSLLCFFPQVLILRSLMKPEILAFAFIGWIILYFEKYLFTKDISYIFYTIPLIVVVLSTKASIGAMLFVYMFTSYYQIIKIISVKQFFSLFFLIIFLFSLIQIENFKITGTLITERVYDEEYDFKADKLIILKFDLDSLLNKPRWIDETEIENYNKNANSVSNILLLDTFGDYFDQYFGTGNFKNYRKDIFITGEVELFTLNRQIRYSGPLSGYLVDQLDYVRKIFSIILSFIFFMSSIILGFKSREKFKFLLLPILSGVFVLYLSAIGVPNNNFAPYKGDTFKAFYFSQLLSISFVFICALLFEKFYRIKYLIFLLFACLIFFIGGHPKINSQELSENLIAKNEFSIFCEVNNFIFFENNLVKNFNNISNSSDTKSDCLEMSYSKKYFVAKDIKKIEMNEYYFSKCLDEKENISLDFSNNSECRIFVIDKVINNENNSNFRLPTGSIVLLVLSLLIILKEILFDKNFNLRKKLNNISFRADSFKIENYDFFY